VHSGLAGQAGHDFPTGRCLLLADVLANCVQVISAFLGLLVPARTSGASDFATAFIEVVVRDRLVQRDRRIVPFGDIAARGWVEFALTGDEPLKLVDLRESGCLVIGAPTDAAHARNQAAGRALSRALYGAAAARPRSRRGCRWRAGRRPHSLRATTITRA
jgi:hypothetical protein